MIPQYWNKGKIYLSKKDPVLKSIIKKYNNEDLLINSNYFHCLVNSIIGQQISVKAANSIKKRFFSLKKNINPKSIINIEPNLLAKVGLSRQKINYIFNISDFFLNNKIFFKTINQYTESEIIEKLVNIKGVGIWTAEMFLIFSLGKPNIFPSKDLGFLKSISINYKKKLPITEKNINFFYNKWSPYNTIATWYLWRSLDPIPINY